LGVHTGHNTAGNVRSFVANHITEFKILLSDLLGKGEIKRRPIGNQGSEKNSSNGKEMETGVTYRVGTPENSVWPAQSEVISWRNPIGGVL